MNFLFNYTPNSAIKSSLIIVGVLVVFFIVMYFFIRRVDPLKKTPIWLIPFLWVVDIVNSNVKNLIGKRWKTYAPLFLTLGIFIFFSNMSGLFNLDNPTGYLIVTFALGMITFFTIQITGVVSLGVKGYLKGFLDPFPIMLPMNIISELALPISLALRLFGNITSGTAINTIVKGTFGWFSLPVVPFINLVLDIASGSIQVIVFVILSMIFTGAKIKDEEKIYSE